MSEVGIWNKVADKTNGRTIKQARINDLILGNAINK